MRYNMLVALLCFALFVQLSFSACNAPAQCAGELNPCQDIYLGSSLEKQCNQWEDWAGPYAQCQQAYNSQRYADAKQLIDNYASTCALYAGFFGVDVDLPASGTKTVSTSLPATITCLQKQTITIRAKDATNSFLNNGGDCFKVVTSGPDDGLRISPISDNEDGTYTFTIRPVKTGNYQLAVNLNGWEQIINIPFTVTGDCKWRGGCAGDPHFTSYTGIRFNYQGVGDFWLTTVGGSIIQTRQQPCRAGSSVTCNHAVAIGTPDGHRVILYLGDTVKVDNVTVVVNSAAPFVVSAYVTITKIVTGAYIVYVPEGSIAWTEYGYHASVEVVFDGPYEPRVGLLSRTARNATSEDDDATGPVSASVSTAQQIQSQRFGDSWRVFTEGESLFYYDYDHPFSVINQPNAPQFYGPYTGNDALVNSACGVLNPATTTTQWVIDCLQFADVNVATYYLFCKQDVIAMEDATVANAWIDGCASACARHNVNGLPTSAKFSGVYNLLSPIKTFTIDVVSIQARNIVGQNRTVNGDTWAWSFTGPAAVTVNTVYKSNGLYQSFFSYSTVGTYYATIKRDGVTVADSPYKIIVTN